MSADLDKSIDRAVREMLAAEPRADLRARVVARIDARPASSFQLPVASWVRFGGLVGAAAVLILFVTVARRSEPPARVATIAHAGEQRPVETRSSMGQSAGPTQVASSAKSGPARVSASLVYAASSETQATAGIDPLTMIAPIEVAPIAQSSITPEPIGVRPLSPITEMQIAPLTPPDGRN
jgi:hypothetical protein